MVAAAPGTAPPDGPSANGSLDSLFEGRGEAGGRAGAGGGRSGAPDRPVTTIDLSGGITPAEPARGGRSAAVPIRHIVGARPPSGRWRARARRGTRVGGWVFGAVTVGAGLAALWVLLFTSVSGGDVWLGRPVSPAKHDQSATQQKADQPAASVRGSSARPSPTATPPKPSTTAAKAATPTQTSGSSHSGSGSSTGGSGRNGADDPSGDDSGGTLTTSTTSGGGSGSSGGSGGSGSSSGGSSGSSGSGHGGSDD